MLPRIIWFASVPTTSRACVGYMLYNIDDARHELQRR